MDRERDRPTDIHTNKQTYIQTERRKRCDCKDYFVLAEMRC